MGCCERTLYDEICVCFLVRFSFASASPDNIKQWKFPDGNFLQNLIGHNSIVNCMAVNPDGVLVSGGKVEVAKAL